jgi:hypothetical protein
MDEWGDNVLNQKKTCIACTYISSAASRPTCDMQVPSRELADDNKNMSYGGGAGHGGEREDIEGLTYRWLPESGCLGTPAVRACAHAHTPPPLPAPPLHER